MKRSSDGQALAIPALIQLIFIVAKAKGMISWSWAVITAPIWITFVLFIVGTILVVIHGTPKEHPGEEEQGADNE